MVCYTKSHGSFNINSANYNNKLLNNAYRRKYHKDFVEKLALECRAQDSGNVSFFFEGRRIDEEL